MIKKLHYFLKNLPVGHKLLAALSVLLITIIAITSLTFISAAYWITQQSLSPDRLRALGGFYANPTLSRQLLSSSNEANTALKQMFEYMHLKGAAIYDRQGLLLATFPQKHAPNFPTHTNDLTKWMGQQFGSSYSIDLDIDSTNPGRLVLLASSQLPNAFYTGTITASLIILFVSILLWFVLAKQIRNHITNPIYELEKLALRITKEENYALRVIPRSTDEIGSLATAFNTMLSRTEAREQQLKTARDQAEKMAEEMRSTNQQLIKEAEVRNKVEKKLTGFQNYLNNIINSMPSALIAVDKALYITQWNQEASHLSGSSIEEAVDQPLFLAFPHMKPYIEQLKACIEHNRIEKIEKITWLQDDQVHHYSLTFYPLSGDVEGGVIRIDDITERLNLHELMVQSEKMLSVGGLAAGMAHEINNPLGAILHNVQNINRRLSLELEKNQAVASSLDISLDKINDYLKAREIQQMLEGIYQAGSRASKIVTNMLSFSRRSKRVFVTTNLIDTIHQTLEIAKNDLYFGENFNFNDIQIKLDLSPDLALISVIPNEIEQVLLNLLKNSAQAISIRTEPQNSQPGTIHIRLYKSHQWAVIQIQDNGVGMSEQTAKRIFEPFYTTKEVGKGTGLGLFVSYFIITNNHKGEISIHSKPGQGTCFTLRLPLNHSPRK